MLSCQENRIRSRGGDSRTGWSGPDALSFAKNKIFFAGSDVALCSAVLQAEANPRMTTTQSNGMDPSSPNRRALMVRSSTMMREASGPTGGRPMAKISKRARKAQPQTRRKPLAPKRTVAPAKAGEANLKQQLAEARAEQAVIAIENVRLFNETKEALERQTATAEILKVIASSPSDVQPVFDAIADAAGRLFEGQGVGVWTVDTGKLKLVARHIGAGLPDVPGGNVIEINRSSTLGQAVLDRVVFQIRDARELGEDFETSRRLAGQYGHSSSTSVPMLREGVAVGALALVRAEPGVLSDNEIALLKTFADQAVIAIENVRLFNETKEALERQTATADILKVIASSPSDVQPVFDAIVKSAERLFGRRAGLRIAEPEGLRLRAHSDGLRPETVMEVMPIDEESMVGQVAIFGRAIQFSDLRGPDAPPFARKHAHTWSFRSNAGAPLIRDGKTIGVISITSPEVGAMTDKQMELLATFADQAVIAIENVRLFNETKEALERQTATADIL